MKGTRLALLLASPLLVAQALWVGLRAARLPEAAGPRTGEAGSGPSFRLLILGDSSAAGVGADHQDDALAGQLARALARHGLRVLWRLEAKSGATTASTLRRLATLRVDRVDAALVVLGVNDATRLVPTARWQARQQGIAARLRRDWGAGRIYWSGMPPLAEFPLLPEPLRRVLGAHAARLDAVTTTAPGLIHLPLELPPELGPDSMAPDGFHPGPAIYAAWAEAVAAALMTPPGPADDAAGKSRR